MSAMKRLAVIGGGPGGYVAALRAAQLGMKVTCIEKRETLGGTCLNVGCIPSKALLQSSHEYENAQKLFPKLGIKATPTFSVPKIMAHKDNTVSSLCSGIDHLFKKNKIERVLGEGSLVGPQEIRVRSPQGDARTMQVDHVLVATGSDVFTLPSMPIDEQTIVSSTGALSFPEVPKHMVVIGAGVIGLELGSVWRRLGAKVTVVELMDRITPDLDRDLSTALQRSLKRQGMQFHMKTLVKGITKQPGGGAIIDVESQKTKKTQQIRADKVLVAIGRRPYTQNLGLKELGIETDRWGFIPVDDQYRTKVPSIAAIGDVIQGPMLAHRAEEDGVACVEMMAGHPAHRVNYGLVPGVIYTHPEVAAVGRSEQGLQKRGIPYKKGVFAFNANGRARASGHTDGFIKILSHGETGKILGVHAVGGVASEMIHEGAVAMGAGMTAQQLGNLCHAHPTLSEAVKEAALAAHDRAIHC
eukprot:gnl/Trimastix_PCT/1613.p1 GENE.gnl/Trimastix_PCT/1613~~gnl/Trimastix_PCT/1613.p1  ORF type:complete len:470 (-),score=143.40 gnl/Trimastix_PCT/1613:62-1471(-)